MTRRRIGVVTTSRAEYGLLRHIVAALHADRRAEVQLVVGGSHLDAASGLTIREIRADAVPIGARVTFPVGGTDGAAAARSAARALEGFGRAFSRLDPDIVLLLGDRYEILAAAIAAALEGRVVAHLNGGEVTGGSLDEGWRHAITKVAHLHLPATKEFAERIRLMGEDAWRIRVVGSPGVEAIRLTPRMSRSALEASLGRHLDTPLALCTYHPVTNDPGASEREAAAIIRGLERAHLGSVLITAPNVDAGGAALRTRFAAAARRHAGWTYVASLGSTRYYSLLATADVMIGNSSSGLIEAPSFRLPVVNVGSRQLGRPRARNVVDVDGSVAAIEAALRRALSPRFRRALRGLRNPYGGGRTSELVRSFLLDVELDSRIRAKRFADS